jgi:hypothetical protein
MTQVFEILNTIQSYINASGTLILPGDALGSDTMVAVFSFYLTDDSLQIAQAQVQASEKAVTVTGRGLGRFLDLAATAVFTPLDDGDTDVTVTGLATDQWLLTKAFPSLVGGSYEFVLFATGSALALHTLPAGGVAAGLSLDGLMLATGLLSQIKPFLAGASTVAIAGEIGVSNQSPSFDMSVVVATGLTVGTLATQDFALRLVSQPFTYSEDDGTTGYGQDAYLALTTSVTYDTKSGQAGAALQMRFNVGAMATLQVVVDGSPGILLDAFETWANANLALGLPDPDLFDPANYLTLDAMDFFIAPTTAAMSSFHLDVSTANAWTIIPDIITITEISFSLISADPVQNPYVTGHLVGNVDLGKDGSVAKIVLRGDTPDYAFSGGLQDGSTVNVKALVEYLIPGAIDIPDIELVSFEFFCQPGEAAAYSLAAAFSIDWELEVSPIGMKVLSAGIDVACTPGESGGTTTGQIVGSIAFDDSVTFDITYSLPGQFQVVGNFDKISLLSSIARLVDMPMSLPSGFDLEFTDVVAVICYGSGGDSDTLEFQIGATVPGLGDVAFDSLRVGTQWGYATGLSLGDVSLSDVPGLSALAPFVDYFHFKKLVLVLSTADLPGFDFPDASVFSNAPASGSGAIVLPAGQGVIKGMNAYAEIDLDIPREPDLSLLINFLHISAELTITLQVGLDSVEDGSALFATMNGTVNSNIVITGSFGAKLLGGVLDLFMTGTLATTLQGQPITFFFSVVFQPNGAFLTGGYEGTIDFVTVKLSNLVIEIGIDLEGIPTIGFGAQIDVDTFDSSVMVLLDSVDPAQSMFVASISDINLRVFLENLCNLVDLSGVPPEIMGALEQTGLSGTGDFVLNNGDDTVCAALNARDVPTVSAAFAAAGISLPSDPLQVIISVATESRLWYVTNIPEVIHYKLANPADGASIAGTLEPQLYVVPQPTQLGLTQVKQGYRANGTLDLFGFKATVDVEIADQQGLTIDVEFSKITITVDDYPVFSLTSADGSAGPALSVCTFANVANTDVAKQKPHFFASGKIDVLGVANESVQVDFSGSGGSFDMEASVAGVANYSMAGTYADTFSFSLSGSAKVGVDDVFYFGVLGKVHVECEVGYEYSVAVVNAHSGSAGAAGTFSFGDVGFTIPTFSLSLDSPSLADLATDAYNQVYDNLETFFKLSEHWLNWVNQGLVIGVETAEQVGACLKTAYNMDYDAIANQTTDILCYNVNQVTQALQGAGATAEETYDVLVYTLNVETEEAARAVEDFFTGSAEHWDQILIPGYNDRTLHVDNRGYNDNTLHIDDNGYNDRTLHVDNKGYNDNTLHTDDNGYNDRTLHVDNKGYNDRTLHVDTKGYNDRTLHVDTKIFGSHDDTGHIDTGHDDTGHIDTGHDDTGHIDYGHVDTGHIDTGHDDTGHIDYGHVDTGHIDTGHDDTGHIDTPDSHVDTKL